MYKKGDAVVHPMEGVCTIEDITEESFGGCEKRKYYVLKTMYDNSSTVIHLPVDGGKIKLRKLLSGGEIKDIIHSVSVKQPLWIADSAERKERFTRIIQDGDYGKILQMICEIHLKQAERVNKGKKPYVSDNKMLDTAEKLLYQEFAHILDIEPDKVADFVISELNIS